MKTDKVKPNSEKPLIVLEKIQAQKCITSESSDAQNSSSGALSTKSDEKVQSQECEVKAQMILVEEKSASAVIIVDSFDKAK